MFRRLAALGLLTLCACEEPVVISQPLPIPKNTGTIKGTLAPFRSSASLVRGAQVGPLADPALRRAVSQAASRVLAARRQTWSAALSLDVKPAEAVPGEVIVRFEDADLSEDEVLARVQLPGYRAVHKRVLTEYSHLVGYESMAPLSLRVDETQVLPQRVALKAGVRSAEKNVRVRAFALPNDPDYTRQWHYPLMNLPAAWDITQGSESINVGVVDSGIIKHPDLNARVAPGADVMSSAIDSGDGDGLDTDPTDVGGDLPQGGSSWHGSHVAGTIGASSNDGYGVAGVTWKGKIVPVRALGGEGGTFADIIVGLQWAAGYSVKGLPDNKYPAQVINMSLGGPSDPSPELQAVIDKIDKEKKAIVVVAAGNDNVDAGTFSPCNQQRVICVGATRVNGLRASYSNFGTAVDVMASGGESAQDLDGNDEPDGVLSTLWDKDKKAVSGYHQGTSMASPHVAGIVALMKAQNPALSVTEVEAILKETADTGSKCSEGCGAGLVNAQAAVLRASGPLNTNAAPKLALGGTRIAFTGNGNPYPLAVRNVGGGSLKVTASVTGSYASAMSFPSGSSVTVPAYGSASLPVTLAASGMADGTYSTQLTLTADNGDRAQVSVKFRVGYLKDQDALLAFLYRDADGEWAVDDEGAGLVTAASAYAFSATLPARTYYAIAVIDDDNDGEYFEDGERIGYWRDATSVEPIELRAGQTVSGIDFTLAPSQP